MSKSNTHPTRWRIRNDALKTLQHKNCLHQPLTPDLGTGYTNICQLEKDFSYIETNYKPSKDLAVVSQMNSQQPRLVVTLGIKGSSRFISHQGEEVVFNKGYTSITTFNASSGERQYQADDSILQLRFAMSKDWLLRYFDRKQVKKTFSNNDNIQSISYKPITAQGLLLAEQLLASNVNNENNKIFIHGLAMMLLASELKPVFSRQNKPKTPYTENDKEIANKAREILFQEFKIPPSVEQLSKRVACNQFKLKKLFHHFFNNTPYGVLLEIRMNKAYQLLESSGCHVNIAADHVGYNHSSNFSTAFIKYFGISPKSICKQKPDRSK